MTYPDLPSKALFIKMNTNTSKNSPGPCDFEGEKLQILNEGQGVNFWTSEVWQFQCLGMWSVQLALKDVFYRGNWTPLPQTINKWSFGEADSETLHETSSAQTFVSLYGSWYQRLNYLKMCDLVWRKEMPPAHFIQGQGSLITMPLMT